MKSSAPILILLFIICDVYGQVGINTSFPDPSAMLHIESDSSGLLIPRLTQTQISNIDNPASGLLTYNKDLKQFAYFDGQWQSLISDQQTRTETVLIKKESDFPAPVAGIITLDNSKSYEISGTIILSNSINMNNATIFGRYSQKDILVAASETTPIFKGSTGGTLRNMTLAGKINTSTGLPAAGGGKAFDLDATATFGTSPQNLVLQTMIITGLSDIGEVDGYGLVFLDVIQFQKNKTGISFHNGGYLLLNLMGWLADNEGTFETITGAFQLIQKQSGFMNVSAGSTGLDVTGITGIAGDAVLEGCVFLGDGTRVKGNSSYTGYNFSNDWTVSSPGINKESDNEASGNYYYNGGLTNGYSFSYTASNINTPQKLEGNTTAYTTTSSNLFRFSYPDDNKLVYDGTKTRNFQVNASISVRVDKPGEFYGFLLAVNGTVITESNAIFRVENSTNIQNIAINSIVTLSNGDYVELFVERLTGSGTATVAIFSENLSIK